MQDINHIAQQLAGGLSLDELRRRQGQAGEFRRREKTPEEAAAEAEYWEKVFAERPKRQTLYVMRSTAQEMDYEEAKKKFWGIMRFRAAVISTLENRPFEWLVDESMKFNLANLVKYFINDPTCKWPLTKGLFIFGQNGTGKTEVMQCLSKFTEQHELTKRFVFTSMSDVYTAARADKESDPVSQNIQYDRCFDEFGRNTGPVIRYGDPIDLNEAILEGRYNRFKNYGQLTHLIANMAPNEAEARFSTMIFDRMRSMCTSVHFQGESKR